MKKNLPIGVLDSGIGGLTVAKALSDLLPNESIIYFGDTANLPYGDKAEDSIQKHVKEIVDFFLEKNVKLIIIACNTASAASYKMLQDYIGGCVLLVDVIDPLARFLKEKYIDRRVGLIGTRFTIESEVYCNKLSELNLCSLAAPSLAPIVEEKGFDSDSLDVALSEYLSSAVLRDIEVLVLGCTHYPIVKTNISDFYKNEVEIVDASEIVAKEVESLLSEKNLLSSDSSCHQFYVSEYTEGFINYVRMFFGDDVAVNQITL